MTAIRDRSANVEQHRHGRTPLRESNASASNGIRRTACRSNGYPSRLADALERTASRLSCGPAESIRVSSQRRHAARASTSRSDRAGRAMRAVTSIARAVVTSSDSTARRDVPGRSGNIAGWRSRRERLARLSFRKDHSGFAGRPAPRTPSSSRTHELYQAIRRHRKRMSFNPDFRPARGGRSGAPGTAFRPGGGGGNRQRRGGEPHSRMLPDCGLRRMRSAFCAPLRRSVTPRPPSSPTMSRTCTSTFRS